MIGARLIVLMLSFFTILLTACHSKHETAPVSPTQHYDRCVQRCLQIESTCNHQCVESCPLCLKKMKAQAFKRFRKYQYEQHIRGCKETRELNSYEDPLQCNKVSCSCAADTKMCVLSCQVQFLPST